jgi:hypothetical protein
MTTEEIHADHARREAERQAEVASVSGTGRDGPDPEVAVTTARLRTRSDSLRD